LIYGHVHQDFFTLIKGHNGRVVNIAYVCPSLSTYTYKNPAFRVFEVEQETFSLVDYVQYSMNITESNKRKEAIWNVSYKFSSYFNVPDLSITSHEELIRKMKTDREIWKKALFVKYQEGEKWKDYFNDEENGKKAMCDYESSTIGEKAECLNVTSDFITNCFTYGFKPLYCKPWEHKVMN